MVEGVRTGATLLQIGEAANRVGLSMRTLRYWEEVGLVRPSARSAGGFRLYSEADVDRLLLLKAMKMLKLDVDDMGVLADLIGSGQPVDESLAAKYLAACEVAVEKLERHLAEVRLVSARLRELA